MTILGEDRDYLGNTEYEQLVDRLSIEELEIQNDQIQGVMTAVDDSPANGGALLRKFRILDEDGVFEYVRKTPNASVNNMLRFSGFLHDFLRSKELNDSIEGLNTEDGFSGYHWHEDQQESDREFDWYHPLYVDGYLAWVMVRGGAYASFEGTQAEAKAFGRQFDQNVFEDRYEDFSVWRIQNEQWSEWFVGTIHWDETLLIADEEAKLIWLFMFTSTD